MKCSVCREKLKSGEYAKCPHCGAPVHTWLQADQKPQKNPLVSVLRFLSKALLLLVMVCAAVCVGAGMSELIKGDAASALYGCFFAGVFALTSWGHRKLGGSPKTACTLFVGMLLLGVMAETPAELPGELNGLSGLVAFACIALVCWGIAKGNKKLIVFPAIFVVAFALMLVGVVNDVPYFIRHIQGEDFIGIWLKYCAVLWMAIFILGRIILSIYAKGMARKASPKKYSDSDLMLLQEFDRYKLVGYYLLKAKLHNVIRYIQAEDGSSANQIGLDDKMTDSERNAYCAENPQVGKIVAYINSKMVADGLSEVSLSEIVRNVVPKPEFQSEGGQFAAKYISKVKNVTTWFFLAGIGATYYPAVTKLLMGMYNGKPVSDLASFCVVIAVVLWYVCGTYCFLISGGFRRKFVGAIVRVKSAEFGNIEYLLKHAKIENSYVPNVAAEKLLRAYALYEYTLKDCAATSRENENFRIATISAVVAAQTAAAAARSSSESGCGCSGCSGCGGGCGGCGGCGN